MPNWNQLLEEMRQFVGVQDSIRRRHASELHQVTGRNVILYYSGWLQKRNVPDLSISDEDKNGFMTVIHELDDRDRGLDLVLHTPGGEVAATESLVDYLRLMFDGDIRAIVPQLAMSAGTMIACASKKIVMGKQSSLGPIDPQFEGIPAHGVVEEFENAKSEIIDNPSSVPVWQPIISKYPPAFIGECRKVIDWANEIAGEWLASGMFQNELRPQADPEQKSAVEGKIKSIVRGLGDHALTKSHSRHLSASWCEKLGLKIDHLEDDQQLQDAVLSLHHACMLTFDTTPAIKLIENHKGTAFIKSMQAAAIMPAPAIVGQDIQDPNQ